MESDTRIIISTLTTHNDHETLTHEVKKVNDILFSSRTDTIDNSNITCYNLNRSNLHLNKSGDVELPKNFREKLRYLIESNKEIAGIPCCASLSTTSQIKSGNQLLAVVSENCDPAENESIPAMSNSCLYL